MYKLIPLEHHCVVEVTDFVLPAVELKSLLYVESNDVVYTTDVVNNQTYKRSIVDTTKEYKLFFNDKINDIINIMKEHPLYAKSKLSTTLKTSLGVSICKDSLGWKQDIHIDHPAAVLSGVIHITDCENSTKFYKSRESNTPLYVASKKAFSGAFWLNTPRGFHGVDPVTLERNHFFFLLLDLEKVPK